MVIFPPFLFHFQHFAPVKCELHEQFQYGCPRKPFFCVSVERRKNSRSEIYLEKVNARLEMAGQILLNLNWINRLYLSLLL